MQTAGFSRGILLSVSVLLNACALAPQEHVAVTQQMPPLQHLANTGLQAIQSFDVYVVDNTVHLVLAGTLPGEATDVAVRYVRSDDGGQHWQAPIAVDTAGQKPMLSRGNDLQIAASGPKLQILWQAQGALPNFGPLASAYSDDAGKTWKPASNPALNAEGDQSHMALTADHQGGLHAVWLEDPEENGYQSLRYASASQIGQAWTAARTLDTSTCSCCWNTLLTTAEGSVAVLYRDAEPRDMRVMHSADAGVYWSAASSVGAFHWAFTGCPHIGGALAQAADVAAPWHGLVWTGLPDKQGLYYVRSHDQGQTWTAPLRMGNKALHGDIAAVESQLLAVWDELQPDGTKIVLAESLDAGVSWRAAKPLSTALQATHPRVVATRAGFLALWTEKSGKQSPQLALVFFAAS